MIAVPAMLGAGVVGAVLRYLLVQLFPTGSRVPWAVLTVNVVGSAIAGFVYGQIVQAPLTDVALVIITGFCGGFTTFSSFTVEAIQLVLEGKVVRGVVSVVAHLFIGLGAAVIGFLAFILTR